MLDLETTLRSTVTAAEMVSGQIWSADQHRRSVVPDPAMVLLILALGPTGHRPEYELEFDDVWWHDHSQHNLLSRQREARIYRAGCACQARSVV